MKKLLMKVALVAAVATGYSVCSCTSVENKDFQDPLEHFSNVKTKELNVTKVFDLEGYDVLRPSKLLKHDGIYFIEDGMRSGSIKSFNTLTLETNVLVLQGEGPDEMISIDDIQILDNDVVAFDHSRQKLYKVYDGKSKQKDFHELRELKLDGRAYITDFKGDGLVASGIFPDAWICCYDSDGLTAKIPHPVFDESEGLSSIEKSILFLSTHVALKPDSSRFAYATQNGGIIGIYKKEANDSWCDVVQYAYYFPKFVKTEYSSSPIAFDREGKTGFCGLCCTNQFIYTIYSGRTIAEEGLSQNAFLCQHVLVYDWDGNPVKHYLLEKPLFQFGVDEDAGIIYGTGYDPEGCIIEYKL